MTETPDWLTPGSPGMTRTWLSDPSADPHTVIDGHCYTCGLRDTSHPAGGWVDEGNSITGEGE